jgi:hypothetical protein
MKIILTLLYFSTLFVSFAQDSNDLGRLSYEAAKSKAFTKYNGLPCGEKENVIFKYCFEDGTFILYIFEKNVLNAIIFFEPYLTKTLAEKELENQVLEFSKGLGKGPEYSKGEAVFNVSSDINCIFRLDEDEGAYYVRFGTHYLK